jgi:hypothetical protein
MGTKAGGRLFRSSPTDEAGAGVKDESARPNGDTLAVSAAMTGELLAVVLERQASFRFTARGGSMSPFIRDADVLTVSPLSGHPPRIGDVVACRLRAGEGLVVHRIVARVGDGFLLRGDNAESADGRVPAADVLGVVTLVERRGRRVRTAIGPSGRLLAPLSSRGWLKACLTAARRADRLLMRITAESRGRAGSSSHFPAKRAGGARVAMGGTGRDAGCTGLISLLAGLIEGGRGETAGLRAAAAAVGDWPEVVTAARVQGLAPLMYRRLADTCSDLVPEAVLDDLRATYLAANQRATRLTATLVRLCDLLAAHGVAGVPIKGPALAQDLYGDIALRGFADLDVLVRTADVVRARGLLLAEGFRPTQPRSDVPAGVLLANESELAVQQVDDGTPVELHWRVGWRLARLSFSAEEILDESRTIDLLGRPVGAPSVRDQVSILTIHGAGHAWDRLEFMVSVVAAAERVAPDDWPALLDRAQRVNILRRVLVGLVLSHETVDLPLPAEVRLRTAADPAVRGLVAGARDTWRDGPQLRGGIRGLRHIAWLARTEDSPEASVVHLVARAFTPGPEDWDSLSLPRRLFRLYYLWRPVRVMGKFARRTQHPD